MGVRFDVGLPFGANHGDASVAAPPLDQPLLFWNRQSGYKFFTADAKVNGMVNHTVHVGSTGCSMRAPKRRRCLHR
ncbi:MAG TPA: MbnP family protein [Myxococcota bacterium]|nr:MbnP family protein [Myxococcota bacterium]